MRGSEDESRRDMAWEAEAKQVFQRGYKALGIMDRVRSGKLVRAESKRQDCGCNCSPPAGVGAPEAEFAPRKLEKLFDLDVARLDRIRPHAIPAEELYKGSLASRRGGCASCFY